MLTEPVTSPKRDFGKLIAGITTGVAVFLFRYFGEFEMGFASALILMNVFSPLFDEGCESVLHVYRHRDSLIRSFKADIDRRKAEKTEKTESEAADVVAEEARGAVMEVSLINTPGEEIIEEPAKETESSPEESEEVPEEPAEEINLSAENENTEEEEAVQ